MRQAHRHTIVGAAVVITSLLGMVLSAQQSPRELFERARLLEDSGQDLLDAVRLYGQVVEQAGAARALAATAQLRLGLLYERLGRIAEAQRALAVVVTEYADQIDVAQQAQTRLAIAGANAGPEEKDTLHTELLWDNAHPFGDISPDGHLVTNVDWEERGNLAIHNLETDESRRLTHTADGCASECAGTSRISPDGEQVLYGWQRPSPDGYVHELRLLPVHGDQAEPRTVWSPADGGRAQVQDWFPSGDRVVAVVRDRDPSSHHSIITVSTVDGRVQQVRSIDWGRPFTQVRVSPDGRYLAYSWPASREAPQSDIFLVAVGRFVRRCGRPARCQ